MDPIPLYYKSYEAPQLGITRPFEGIKMELLEGGGRDHAGRARI